MVLTSNTKSKEVALYVASAAAVARIVHVSMALPDVDCFNEMTAVVTFTDEHKLDAELTEVAAKE